MRDSNLPSADLLKSVLEPLLEDFQYWFERYSQILENEKIQFMSEQEQLNLLKRVKDAECELNTVRMLFTATEKQVGIDMASVMPWHQLVTECWSVGMRLGQSKE
ncbi:MULTISPECIES: DUF2605 domain-containing protein [Nostocales]|jgi:hypothetical protein|uniref:DUF2605 domain-containing protein n=2 Tax=Aphanizomenonaceae TaxID=1892259 RepID=A0ACC7S6A2_DOLFA|nr:MULTISPECIES: DUF2605 domain-containing protein [Nostocales]MBO1071036.1 DUF2605 domain-containing protein [Dolichospermum sp. DEX189]QSV70588.1 MAG: DUF2605 domain-containing protein [Aphanizomenon flos-aquae KM1D3_PB]KHG41802.1 hypothetical protein OA07_09110 [Aphanizomenon flos-aquae 2012/KM1/D3]MBD2276848.1 DUF2605 domain-containing protein [Aphanizomenon flos-aquae FACHB-1040]MBO1065102.1 DUF2605 domain-containing protein [Anabaena sp. 54]